VTSGDTPIAVVRITSLATVVGRTQGGEDAPPTLWVTPSWTPEGIRLAVTSPTGTLHTTSFVRTDSRTGPADPFAHGPDDPRRPRRVSRRRPRCRRHAMRLVHGPRAGPRRSPPVLERHPRRIGPRSPPRWRSPSSRSSTGSTII
jgi:hypothetical protein